MRYNNIFIILSIINIVVNGTVQSKLSVKQFSQSMNETVNVNCYVTLLNSNFI